uniref:Uncharacterized protein n=1 Tax=Scylla olivacea TaxID=85551 RepID=A0A0P4VR13_SCYOL
MTLGMTRSLTCRLTHALLVLRGGRAGVSRLLHYEQGQNPQPGIREYFYYIDHQGMLFLDDARMKNFTSCFKDHQGDSRGSSRAPGLWKRRGNHVLTFSAVRDMHAGGDRPSVSSSIGASWGCGAGQVKTSHSALHSLHLWQG